VLLGLIARKLDLRAGGVYAQAMLERPPRKLPAAREKASSALARQPTFDEALGCECAEEGWVVKRTCPAADI